MKRRLVSAFLVVLAAWPLLHFALVKAYGVDPWKLMGFAMYCVPGPMKTVRVHVVSRDGERRTLDYRRYSPPEQLAVDTFREKRRYLGRLHSSDALAAALFELHPGFEGVVIEVFSLEMEVASARVRAHQEYATHWRDGRDEPFDLSAGRGTQADSAVRR